MRFILQKTLLTIITSCLVILTGQVAFAEETCSTLPNSDLDNYLEDNTAYGYIKKQLQMKSSIDGACGDIGDEIRFCIKNQEGFSDYCRPVSLMAGESIRLSELNPNAELANNIITKNIFVEAQIIGNDLCLLMPTSRGMSALLCRSTNGVNTDENEEDEDRPTVTCRNINSLCLESNANSQSLISFSGRAIECVRETLDQVFYVGSECDSSDYDLIFSTLTPFPEFQNAMRSAVMATLTIYVIIYGFSLIMDENNGSKEKIITFVLKFLLVSYFAIGLGNSTIIGGREVQQNGMTGFALPFLVEMTNNFTELTFLAAGSQGLCDFDVDKYNAGLEYYKIWDAIDCRVGYYLGVQLFYNIGDILNSMSSSPSGNAATGEAVTGGSRSPNAVSNLSEPGEVSFIPVMFGLFLRGQVIIVILGILFAIIFVSVLIFFISIYITCLVTLYAMAYISPIFITMALFERTKPYFDSWLRIVISCTLQPAIIGCFIAILVTMYDSIIYENCEFQRYDYTLGEHVFSTFALHEPLSEPERCRESLGYKLLRYYLGDEGWESKTYILFQIYYLVDYLNLGISLIYVMVYVFIFHFFMKSAAEFAADITGGPKMESVTISPNIVFQKTVSTAIALIALVKAAGKLATGNTSGAEKELDKAKEKSKEGVETAAKDDSVSDIVDDAKSDNED